MSQEHLTIFILFVTWVKLDETRFPDYVVEKLTKPLTDSRVLVRTTFIGLFSSSLSFPFPLVCTTAQHPVAVRVLPTWLDKSPLPVQGVK